MPIMSKDPPDMVRSFKEGKQYGEDITNIICKTPMQGGALGAVKTVPWLCQALAMPAMLVFRFATPYKDMRAGYLACLAALPLLWTGGWSLNAYTMTFFLLATVQLSAAIWLHRRDGTSHHLGKPLITAPLLARFPDWSMNTKMFWYSAGNEIAAIVLGGFAGGIFGLFGINSGYLFELFIIVMLSAHVQVIRMLMIFIQNIRTLKLAAKQQAAAEELQATHELAEEQLSTKQDASGSSRQQRDRFAEQVMQKTTGF